MMRARLAAIIPSLLALAAGALLPLSLAPFNFWPMSLLAPTVLAALLLQGDITGKRAFLRAWSFGVGMYLSGVSWVYVAIHDFAYTPVPLAVAMTAIFVIGMGLVFGLPFCFYGKLKQSQLWHKLCVFPVFWVLGEWLRGWVLTGFPWLFLGYAHLDTPLAGFAPVLGIFGVSALAVFSGNLILHAFKHREKAMPLAGLLAALWSVGWGLSFVSWTQKADAPPLKVALVQPNISLEIKWDPSFRPFILDTLRKLSNEHWDKDLIVWPEAAIPLLYHEGQEFRDEIDNLARQLNTGVITGVLYDNYAPIRYYNSIIGLGDANGIYHKQRLVPFGEYVPLESWLRGLIHFFDLPNSIIHAGPDGQAGLTHDSDQGSYTVAPFICYEIVYPDLVARNSRHAEVMVTISNDAWFGRSIGPKQHFQMAQMRALENGRYVIRATNTGISGIIDPKGQISFIGEAFSRTSFSAEVNRMEGLTPFARLGSYPIVLLCFLLLGITIGLQRKRNNTDNNITNNTTNNTSVDDEPPVA